MQTNLLTLAAATLADSMKKSASARRIELLVEALAKPNASGRALTSHVDLLGQHTRNQIKHIQQMAKGRMDAKGGIDEHLLRLIGAAKAGQKSRELNIINAIRQQDYNTLKRILPEANLL